MCGLLFIPLHFLLTLLNNFVIMAFSGVFLFACVVIGLLAYQNLHSLLHDLCDVIKVSFIEFVHMHDFLDFSLSKFAFMTSY